MLGSINHQTDTRHKPNTMEATVQVAQHNFASGILTVE